MPNILVLTVLVQVLALFVTAAVQSDPQDIVTIPLTKRHVDLPIPIPSGASIKLFFSNNIPQSFRKSGFVNRLLPAKGSQPLQFNHRKGPYTAVMTIGTPPQKLIVGFDTTLGNSWIATNFPEDKRPDPRKYSPSHSHSFINTTLHYHKRWASKVYTDGFGYRDTMAIGDIEVTGQFFYGVPLPPSSAYFSPVNGMIALGLDFFSSSTKSPFMYTALRKGLIKYPVFGMSLAPEKPEIHFGGTNTNLYLNPLEFHEVVHFKEGDAAPRYWMIGNGQLRAGNRVVSENLQAIISTKFELTLGPSEAVKNIYASIPMKRKSEHGFYVFPCGSAPKVFFSWDHKQQWEYVGFEIPLGTDTSMECMGSIMEHRSPELGDRWEIGTSFWKNLYVMFDIKQKEVGFGKLR